MKHSITFIGLDVHKDLIDIALADDGRTGEVRSHVAIAGDIDSLDKAIRKLGRCGAELRFVYEAGPCGYEIYRHLTAQGFHCDVVAPAMTPRRSGQSGELSSHLENKACAELPPVERDSSAMNTSHAVKPANIRAINRRQQVPSLVVLWSNNLSHPRCTAEQGELFSY